MASKEMPFDEDVMTLIMGVDPSEPGQHGRVLAPMADKDAITLITEIRDMCEDYLMSAGKRGGDETSDDAKDDNTANEEEE